MTWLFYTLSILFLFFLFLIFSPIQLYLGFAPLLFKLKWIGLTFSLEINEGKKTVAFSTLSFSFTLNTEPKAQKKSKKRKKKVQTSKKPATSKSFKEKIKSIYPLLTDPVLKKITLEVLHLLEKILSSLKLAFLRWDYCLEDYFLQGILCGFSNNLPSSKRFSVKGNFLGENRFDLQVNASPAKILLGVTLFLVRFPYYRAILIYRGWRRV